MPNTVDQYNPQFPLPEIRSHAKKAWMLGFALVITWALLIILAPAADAFGIKSVSGPIYSFFSVLCHQIPDRSFHFFHHPFAVCSRCFGVYFGLVLGFIIYPFIKRIEETEPFPRIWLFLSLVPIGTDWSLGIFGIWENTHFTRFTTGTILGIACAVFIIPAIVELKLLRSQKRKPV